MVFESRQYIIQLDLPQSVYVYVYVCVLCCSNTVFVCGHFGTRCLVGFLLKFGSPTRNLLHIKTQVKFCQVKSWKSQGILTHSGNPGYRNSHIL